jgi:PPOX class probable F420-dependent enzyme
MSGRLPDGVRVALEKDSADWGRRHLDEDIVGWLATVTADGRVQTSPVAFLWDGETILVYSEPDAPKVRNIAGHPQVSFQLNCDEFGDRVLIVEGTAEIDAATPAWADNPAMVAKYHDHMAHWNLDEAENSLQFSTPIRIRPTRIRAW